MKTFKETQKANIFKNQTIQKYIFNIYLNKNTRSHLNDKNRNKNAIKSRIALYVCFL